MSQIAIAIKLASGRPSRGYGIDNPRIADGSIIRDVTRREKCIERSGVSEDVGRIRDGLCR